MKWSTVLLFGAGLYLLTRPNFLGIQLQPSSQLPAGAQGFPATLLPAPLVNPTPAGGGSLLGTQPQSSIWQPRVFFGDPASTPVSKGDTYLPILIARQQSATS